MLWQSPWNAEQKVTQFRAAALPACEGDHRDVRASILFGQGHSALLQSESHPSGLSVECYLWYPQIHWSRRGLGHFVSSRVAQEAAMHDLIAEMLMRMKWLPG